MTGNRAHMAASPNPPLQHQSLYAKPLPPLPLDVACSLSFYRQTHSVAIKTSPAVIHRKRSVYLDELETGYEPACDSQVVLSRPGPTRPHPRQVSCHDDASSISPPRQQFKTLKGTADKPGEKSCRDQSARSRIRNSRLASYLYHSNQHSSPPAPAATITVNNLNLPPKVRQIIGIADSRTPTPVPWKPSHMPSPQTPSGRSRLAVSQAGCGSHPLAGLSASQKARSQAVGCTRDYSKTERTIFHMKDIVEEEEKVNCAVEDHQPVVARPAFFSSRLDDNNNSNTNDQNNTNKNNNNHSNNNYSNYTNQNDYNRYNNYSNDNYSMGNKNSNNNKKGNIDLRVGFASRDGDTSPNKSTQSSHRRARSMDPVPNRSLRPDSTLALESGGSRWQECPPRSASSLEHRSRDGGRGSRILALEAYHALVAELAHSASCTRTGSPAAHPPPSPERERRRLCLSRLRLRLPWHSSSKTCLKVSSATVCLHHPIRPAAHHVQPLHVSVFDHDSDSESEAGSGSTTLSSSNLSSKARHGFQNLIRSVSRMTASSSSCSSPITSARGHSKKPALWRPAKKD